MRTLYIDQDPQKFKFDEERIRLKKPEKIIDIPEPIAINGDLDYILVSNLEKPYSAFQAQDSN